MAYTYIQAIGLGFPDVQCHVMGDGSIYEEIVWDAGAALPSKETLDAWIASNAYVNTTKITVLAFRNRFTAAEKVMIDMASIDVPTATLSERQLAATLRVNMQDLTTATYIDLGRPDIISAVQSLEYFGVIPVGRADEILNNPVQAIEVAIVVNNLLQI